MINMILRFSGADRILGCLVRGSWGPGMGMGMRMAEAHSNCLVAEVPCVRKLGIINGFGHHPDRPFHDLLYGWNYYKLSKLQPFFLFSFSKRVQSLFFALSIDGSRALLLV